MIQTQTLGCPPKVQKKETQVPENTMTLFLIHCGFYEEIGDHKIFEMHTNFFVVAENVLEARKKAKTNPEFIKRKMHIDGLMEIHCVDGYKLNLVEEKFQKDEILSHGYVD